MKRIQLTKEELSVIDYHLKELSKKRAQIVGLNNTPEEIQQLKDLETQCAFKCFEVNEEFAISTWTDLRF